MFELRGPWLRRGKHLSGMNDPFETDVEEANSRLTEGLKACRSIVSNYRAMIAGDQTSEPGESEIFKDEN